MTGIIIAWVVFPLVMVLLALGCGLLIELGSGIAIPGVLLFPIGLAVIIVVADIVTAISATAQFAVPVVVAIAVTGLGLSFPLRRQPDGWSLAASCGVFAVYGAPIVLSGTATFAGYITLDDTNTWLALVDRALEHGRSLSGLAPSTYAVVLNDYLGSGYPLGAFLPLGIGGKLVGEDTAWLFQPMIALYAAALACAIYSLSGDLVRRPPLRAAVAFLGAQAALLFSYAMWSGIKELATAFILALLPAVILLALGRRGLSRSALPVAFVGAALLAVLGTAGAVWLVAPASVAILLLIIHDLRPFAWRLPALVVGFLALSIPSFTIAASFLSSTSGNELTSSDEVANLGHPLSTLQVFGIWPADDFRMTPAHSTIATILIILLGLSAAYAVYEGRRTRAWAMPLYLGVSASGAIIVFSLKVVGLSSPWLNAKAMAEASPGIVATAVAGVCLLIQTGRLLVAAIPAVAIAGGVLWSNVLTYHGVWLAPRDQLGELQAIGDTYRGMGPTLMTEYQPYGARHFLREMDAEAASDRRARFIALRAGGSAAKGQAADVDAIVLNDLLVYRTLVLRTSAASSRPPSIYSLVRRDRWYEVWQRPEPVGDAILEHLSVGTGETGVAAVPRCTDVLRLGAIAAQNGGRLAVSRRTDPFVVNLDQGGLPPGWSVGSPGVVTPNGDGRLALDFQVPATGSYGLYLGGSFRKALSTTVDGLPLGSVKHQLNNAGQWTPLGMITLNPGSHRAIVTYDGSNLAPGTGSWQFGMGPLAIGRTDDNDGISFVAPSEARSLCGTKLDWIEAVRS